MDEKIQELLKEIEKAKSKGDTERAKKLEIEIHTNKAKQFANLAETEIQKRNISQAKKYHDEEINTLKDLGEKLLKDYKDELRSKYSHAAAYEREGDFYCKLTDYRNSINFYNSAAESYREIESFDDVGDCFLGIAACFAELFEIDKEAEYIEKARENYRREAERTEDPIKKAILLGHSYRIHTLYCIRRGDFYLARANFVEAEEIFRSAVESAGRAKNYFVQGKASKDEKEAMVLGKLAEGYEQLIKGSKHLPDISLARKGLEKALTIFEKIPKEDLGVELRPTVEFIYQNIKAQCKLLVGVEQFREGAFEDAQRALGDAILIFKEAEKYGPERLRPLVSMSIIEMKALQHAFAGEGLIHEHQFQKAIDEFNRAIKTAEKQLDLYEKLIEPLKKNLILRKGYIFGTIKRWRVYCSIIEAFAAGFETKNERILSALERMRMSYAHEFFNLTTPLADPLEKSVVKIQPPGMPLTVRIDPYKVVAFVFAGLMAITLLAMSLTIFSGVTQILVGIGAISAFFSLIMLLKKGRYLFET